MVCYEYHFITFPFSRKNKNSGGLQVGSRGKASNFYRCVIWTNPGLRKSGHRLHHSITFLDGPNFVSVLFCFPRSSTTQQLLQNCCKFCSKVAKIMCLSEKIPLAW